MPAPNGPLAEPVTVPGATAHVLSLSTLPPKPGSTEAGVGSTRVLGGPAAAALYSVALPGQEPCSRLVNMEADRTESFLPAIGAVLRSEPELVSAGRHVGVAP